MLILKRLKFKKPLALAITDCIFPLVFSCLALERMFINLMIKDLRHYYTLPTNSIRRVAELFDSEASMKAFRDEINYLKERLGENYLHDIERRTKDRNKVVIIAMENNDMDTIF